MEKFEFKVKVSKKNVCWIREKMVRNEGKIYEKFISDLISMIDKIILLID